MDNKIIEENMFFLEEKIKYKFNDISLLAQAMKSVKIKELNVGKNHKEYSNERLAIVGDAVLKAVISDVLYCKKIATKGEITNKKKKLENNKILHVISISEGIINYAYNNLHFYDPNLPKHERVVCKKHDPYIEAIVGAIYYDGGFNSAKKWIVDYLLPLLEKYNNMSSDITNVVWN